MSKQTRVTVATAKQINEQHRLARTSAETAIEHAVMCGQMLSDKKASLAHGEFKEWIDKNCDFAYSTAARYMKAAQSPETEIATLGQLYPKQQQKPAIEPVQKSTRVDFFEKTAAEKAPISVVEPAFSAATLAPELTSAPTAKPTAPVVSTTPAAPPSSDADPDEPDRPDDIDEDAALAAAEREFLASLEKAMSTDALAEIKRLTAEISVLKFSRDGYMNGKAQVTKMLEAEQRKVTRLEKKLKEAEALIDKLRGEAA